MYIVCVDVVNQHLQRLPWKYLVHDHRVTCNSDWGAEYVPSSRIPSWFTATTTALFLVIELQGVGDRQYEWRNDWKFRRMLSDFCLRRRAMTAPEIQLTLMHFNSNLICNSICSLFEKTFHQVLWILHGLNSFRMWWCHTLSTNDEVSATL